METKQAETQNTATPIPELEQTNGTRSFAIFLLVLSIVSSVYVGSTIGLYTGLLTFASGVIAVAAFFTAGAVVARLNRIIELLKGKS